MNLIDLIARKDKRLRIGSELKPTFRDWAGVRWRGVTIPAAGPQIALSQIGRLLPLRHRPEFIGWHVTSEETDVEVVSEIVAGGRAVAQAQTRSLRGQVTPIRLAWPADGTPMPTDAELRLTFKGAKDAALLVHRVLDRKRLYDLAKGRGVELGPGPKPQIIAADDVDVRYIEEMPADEWKKLYDTRGKYGADEADWSKYIIGTADRIPAEKGSLDFIFSCHVFEHLANPLGHLLRWKEVLRPCGVILAVVPEINSTKDFVGRPSQLADIVAEWRRDIWRPQLEHYDIYAQLRGYTRERAKKDMDSNSSIHVHYYDLPLISRLLEHCVEAHGFSAYQIFHSPNHKDFHFCLWR